MRKQIKISKRLKLSFKRYYDNRRNQKKGWDKQADLKNIEHELPKSCVYFQACAGTFWVTWKNPCVQTTHSENNYWCNKILARKKGGEWKFVRGAQ